MSVFILTYDADSVNALCIMKKKTHIELVKGVSEKTGFPEEVLSELVHQFGEMLAEEILEKGYVSVPNAFTVTLVWRRNWMGFYERLPNGHMWCPFLYPAFAVRIWKQTGLDMAVPLRRSAKEWRRAYRNGWKPGEPASLGHIIIYNESHARRRRKKSASRGK